VGSVEEVAQLFSLVEVEAVLAVGVVLVEAAASVVVEAVLVEAVLPEDGNGLFFKTFKTLVC
jgi:hypothetical protein